MRNIIKGMNVIEQTPIKNCTTLSGVLIALGFCIAIITVVVFRIKTKPDGYTIDFKSKLFKGFLLFYVFGLVLAVFAVMPFPWFQVETGKYTYKCELENDVSANYISDNFNIISVENGVWTIEDK